MRSWAVAVLLLSTPAAGHVGLDAELAALDDAVARAPDDARLLCERAALAHLAGDHGSALGDLDAAHELDPELGDIVYRRGLVLADLGDWRPAVVDLTTFLELHPGHARALLARSGALAALGRSDDARADLEASLAARPTVEGYLGLCGSDAECYERGLSVLHGAVVLKRALMKVVLEHGEYDRALQISDELVASSAVPAEALLERAEIFERRGDAGAARRDREAALVAIDRTRARHPSRMHDRTRQKVLLALGRAVR